MYYNYLNKVQQHIPFLSWFEQSIPTLNVLTKDIPWITTNSRSVYEFYPPITATISLDVQNKQYFATPYKTNTLNNLDKNFDNLIQQNNYTNAYLQQVERHLTKLESIIKPSSSVPPKTTKTSSPMFIPHELPSMPPLSNSNTEKLDKINEMLEKLSLSDRSTKNKNVTSSSLQVITQQAPSDESSSISSSESTFEADILNIQDLESQFQDDLTINKIHTKKKFSNTYSHLLVTLISIFFLSFLLSNCFLSR